MRKRLFLVAFLVVGIFSSCGYCSVVAEVDWRRCTEPPIERWTIWPRNPTSTDIIDFSGPTGMYSNGCYGDMAMGGSPTLTIDEAQRTVQLWFQPPAPDICMDVVIPVCGLEGQFGPLSEGDWVFFCDGTAPDPWVPPDPWQWPRFHIPFDVSAAPLLKLEDPNGGQSWVAGSLHKVRWRDLRAEGACPGVYVIQYSTDNGHTWTTELTIPGRCSFWWSVPDVDSDECLVRVSDASDPAASDRSDQTFTIYQCTKQLPGDQNVDCYVNGYDYALVAWWWSFGLADIHELAALAESWLMCGNPFDPGCVE